MAKNDDNKKSRGGVEDAARELLKKLSNQYDAESVNREKKMADTLSSIPYDESSENSRLSTKEFDRIFDKFSSEEKSADDESEPLTVEEESFDVSDDEFKNAAEKVEFEKEPASSFEETEKDAVEEPAEKADASSAEYQTFEDITDMPEPDIDDRADTNVFADRMVSPETIESFEPVKADDAGEIAEESIEETFAKAEQLDEEYSSKQADTADFDTKAPTDTQMMKAFGLDPSNDAEKDDAKKIFDEYSFESTDELDSMVGTTTTSLDISEGAEIPAEDAPPSFEYTEPSQKKDIFATLREKYLAQKIKMVVAGLFAVLLFVIEALPRLAPSVDIFSGNIMAAAIVDVCILLCLGLLVISAMLKSAKLLFKGKFNADTVTLVSFTVSLVVSAVSLVAMLLNKVDDVPYYNFAFAVCALFSIIFEFTALRRDVYTFKIVSATETKSVLTKLNRVDRYAEEKEFGEYMGDYSDVYKVNDTDFVADFFKKRNEVSHHAGILAFMLPISLLIAIVAMIVSLTALGNDAFTAISHGFMAYCFCAPVTALVSFTYPMYLAAQRAYSYSSAIIGDNTPDACNNISVITFTDNDAFPPERIKIKSVKVFENYHIENVIYYASSVFSMVGGPLATVFKQATLDSINSDNVEIKEITDLGIDAFVDGRHIVIGQPAYMESQCFETMFEAGDEEYEGQTNKRVLYLACDEVVVAKFYIQYNVSSDFLYIVRHLAREGMCVSIRSSDPCVDNDILYRNKMDPTEYPVRIIKGQGPEEKKESISTSDGSIISTGSRKGLVKTLLLCDKILNLRKTNLVVKVLSMVIGAVAAGFLITAAAPISSLFPAVYQVFWMIPIFIVSKIYI